MRGDGGASPQLAFDDAEDAALLAGDKDPSRRRRIMTAISLVDVGALDLSSGEALLISLADAFNAHDLDRIMSHFADDAVLEMPRGKDSWGARFVGKAAVREGLAGRFKECRMSTAATKRTSWRPIPGISKWTVTGTSQAGKKIRANGCNFNTFRAGLVVKKDSYWKILGD